MSVSKFTCLSKPSLKITVSLKEFKLCKITALRDAWVPFLQLLSADCHNGDPGGHRRSLHSGDVLVRVLASTYLTSLFARTSFKFIRPLKASSNKPVLQPEVLGAHGNSFCLEMIVLHMAPALSRSTVLSLLYYLLCSL